MDLLKIPYEHPFAIEWKIKKSDALRTLKTELLFSQIYSASEIAGVRYFFVVFPNGHSGDSEGETGIGLQIQLGNVKKAFFKFSSKSANRKQSFKERIFIKNGCHGFMLCKTDQFFDPANNYFVNDEFIIKFNGTLTFDRMLVSKISYPIPTKWTIQAPRLERLRTSVKKCIKSETFIISSNPEIKYCLRIYPNGHNEENRGKVFIFFCFEFSNEIFVQTAMSIKFNQRTVSIPFKNFYEKSDGYGIKICSTEEFFDLKNEYFINGEMTIEINGHIFVEKKDPVFLLYFDAIETGTITTTQYNERNFVIAVGGQELHVSKNLLADVSTVFSGMMKSGMKETIKNKTEIPDFPFKTVDSAIKLIYDISSALFNQHIESGQTYGFLLCTTDEVFDPKNGYFVNGEMKIELNGQIFVEKKVPEFPFYFDAIETGTPETTEYDERNFVIVVDGQEITVNKELLSNVSTVFAGMMKSGMKETIENKIEITDFPFKTVDSAIKLIYEISPTFTLEDMLPLLVFSDKYDIQLIKDLIEDHLIKELLPSNVCQLIHFSNLFNASKLYEKSVEYFLKCYKESIGVNDLDLLEKEMLHQIFVSALPSISY